MAYAKRTKKWFWRWRNNPLRRRDDVAEAWIILALWAVVAVGGTAVGLVTAHATNETLAQLRADRRSTHAVLLTDTPKHMSVAQSSEDKASATVRWRTPDGSARTGRTLVDTGLKAGTRVVVWQDGHSTLVAAPPSAREAAVEEIAARWARPPDSPSPARYSAWEPSCGGGSTGSASTAGDRSGTWWVRGGDTGPAEAHPTLRQQPDGPVGTTDDRA